MSSKIGVIGECMLELSGGASDFSAASLSVNLAYGGDTLNCSVYLARLGVAVDYVTALGDDSMSDWMVQQWQGEGVGCELVSREPDAVPGLYMIETDEYGERSFYYWRDNAPARRLLQDPEAAAALFGKLANHTYLVLTGISLAIYDEASRQRLFQLLADYRSAGGKVVFDGNYRPRLWQGIQQTREAYEAIYRLTDIALPTFEDEQQVFGEDDQGETVQRLQSWGVPEIALKMGPVGCLVVREEEQELVASHDVTVVDTTSAGDSFNAGYLAARLQGKSVVEAAQAGHDLASVVIQHRGAIIPATAMP